MGIRNAAIALGLAIQLSAVIAAGPPGAPIVGCSAIGCPTGPGNSTSANCLVAGRSSSLIGLAKFNSSIVGGDNLTWSETVRYDNASSTPQFSFERTFYLGAPQGFNLTANATSSSFGACAIFFTNISAEAKFPGDNIGTSFGTCRDAITADCTNALIRQAQIAVGPAKNSSSCESLKAEITKNPPQSCSKFATGDGTWNGIEVKDLTGPNAPKPLTPAEQSASTCYPTLPKTNSLTNVASFNGNSSRQLSSQTASIFAVTPILTVFFPKDNSTKALGAVEASLTCLKPIDETDASDATQSPGGPEKPSEAVCMTSKLSMLGIAMVVSSFLMIFD